MNKITAIRKSIIGLKLLGKNAKYWKVRIWENLGWHYAFYCGGLQLYGDSRKGGPDEYSCMLSDTNSPIGGSMLWTVNKSFKSPQKAVMATLNEADRVVGNLLNIVSTAKKRIGL